jgi:hypothetical protein
MPFRNKRPMGFQKFLDFFLMDQNTAQREIIHSILARCALMTVGTTRPGIIHIKMEALHSRLP